MSIEKFILNPPLILQSSLSQLRYLILSEGLPLPDENNRISVNRLRSDVWSILSNTSLKNSTPLYLSLVNKGQPPQQIYNKIKNDTFRTLATDQNFTSRVNEWMLIRCLSCFAWLHMDEENSTISTYVQGMNVLLAPLLYVSPSEPIGFSLFINICEQQIPTYCNNSLSGVYVGAKLLDKCLKLIDPKLFKFLMDNLLTAEIYGIPSILTLSSCNKPLDQVVKLWDFMFAYGFHMNILFIVALMVTNRLNIMNSKSPMNYLKQFPYFDSDEIIRLGVGFVAKLPSDLYDLLVLHLTNSDLQIS